MGEEHLGLGQHLGHGKREKTIGRYRINLCEQVLCWLLRQQQGSRGATIKMLILERGHSLADARTTGHPADAGPETRAPDAEQSPHGCAHGMGTC